MQRKSWAIIINLVKESVKKWWKSKKNLTNKPMLSLFPRTTTMNSKNYKSLLEIRINMGDNSNLWNNSLSLKKESPISLNSIKKMISKTKSLYLNKDHSLAMMIETSLMIYYSHLNYPLVCSLKDQSKTLLL